MCQLLLKGFSFSNLKYSEIAYYFSLMTHISEYLTTATANGERKEISFGTWYD
jgi:hypothetical protein